MNSTVQRAMWLFLAAFLIAVAGIFVYQVVWAWPAQRCIQAHKWWDPYERVCATPIDLPRVTGRPNKPPPVNATGAKAS